MGILNRRWIEFSVILTVLNACNGQLKAAELTIDNVTTPARNSADEPLAGAFSLAKGVSFLDQASLDWTKQHECFTCHTNYAYLFVRPRIDASVTAHRQVRAALEAMVEKRWAKEGPRWDAEVIMTAAALAVNDAETTGTLHRLTRQALDRMWTLQHADGGFEWLKCDWPPMESDDDFAIPMAMIAAGAAPDNYLATPVAQQGIAKMREYLQHHPAPTLHHRAMLVWASRYVPELMSVEARRAIIEELLALQKADGGWALATLGNWQRADKSAQDIETSDGYATGFVLHVLHVASIPRDEPAVVRGLAWLKNNQRASGRWFSRSVHEDSQHYISHAGTAFAVLALTEFEADPTHTVTP